VNCPSCATELPAEARFCLHCGTSLPVGPLPAEERRVVTVVFCDLVGSTELAGALDPELLRTVLLRYYAVMREHVERHGGVVEKFIGDAVMAVFGLLSTREDDAVRAAAAALEMAAAPSRLGDELPASRRIGLAVRIGVHTGEVVTTADPSSRQALVSGDVVNVAARLQAAAGTGEVLLSAEAVRAAGIAVEAEPVGALRLKGVAEPVPAARLLALRDADPHATRRFDVSFVGRAPELETLALVRRRVTEQGEAHVLTLLGEAGVGKSRLLDHWLSALDAGRWPAGVGRCRPHGAAGSLSALGECVAPLVHALGRSGHATQLDAAVDLLRGGLLLDGTPSPSLEETYAALVHVLGALAGEAPLLLIVDDCQWADPALLGVLDRLASDLDRLPLLLVCAARPELLEAHAGWGTGRLSATTLLLGGLGREESELLAASLAELLPHDGTLLGDLVDQAGGNPLYLEQLAATLGDDGERGARIPRDLHALLAARIDRLGDADRLALRHAAVLDGEFGTADLHELTPDAVADDCAAALRSLTRRRFLESARGSFGAPPEYTFTNSVAQRVAYDGLTKRRRAELHALYADRLAATRAPDAQVGHHLARAYGYRAEVGPTDGIEELRLRAVGRLRTAGSGALRRMDLPRALALLDQAVAISCDTDESYAPCLEQLGEAQLTVGRLDAARDTLTRAIAAADNRDQRATAAHARLQLAISRRDHDALVTTADQARDVFAEYEDELGLARAGLVLADSLQRRGKYDDALAELERALDHSRAAAADRELANTLGAIGLALWHGPQPASLAARRCEELLAEFGRGRAAVQATLGFPLAVLYAIQGRREAAEECRLRTTDAMRALAYAEAAVFAPLLEALLLDAADRPEAAEPLLLDALEAARELRAEGLVLPVSLELAQIRLARRDPAGAARAVADCRIGAETRPRERAELLGLTARIAAERGNTAEADRLIAAAADAGQSTDSPAAHALALLDSARVRALLGQPATATAARGALDQYSAKEHAVGAARARRLLDERRS
jgi:class 3 adenylate cyclase/tetratricopeptide (TPR) repeat protein